MDQSSIATFDLRTDEERFPTLWVAFLQEHSEDCHKTPEAVLGIAFLERLDPEQGEWTWLNLGRWAGTGVAMIASLLTVLAMVGDGIPVLWTCLAILTGAFAWECHRRLRKPTYRELQACLHTAEQHAWFVRLETCRAKLEAGKRSVMRRRGHGASIIKKEDFAGLNGLRLIVRSGAIDAIEQTRAFFVEAPRAAVSELADNAPKEVPPVRHGGINKGSPSASAAVIREADHPFTGIDYLAFEEALDQYLQSAHKTQTEKQQFRFVNLKAWELVERDPCLQIGQIANNVRESAKAHYLHIDYTDEILAKIVGKSAKGTYGKFKAYLIKQGLVH